MSKTFFLISRYNSNKFQNFDRMEDDCFKDDLNIGQLNYLELWKPLKRKY